MTANSAPTAPGRPVAGRAPIRPDNRAPIAVASRRVNSDTDSDSVGYPRSSEKRWIIEISTNMNPSPIEAK